MAEAAHFFYYTLLLALLHASLSVKAAVIITKDNSSLVFQSADASFTPKAPSVGICGILVLGNPLDACEPLNNVLTASEGLSCSPFALVFRGSCSFDSKVRHAQDAGFQAVLVADNMESADLVTMAGNKRGIVIPAVFISKVAGDVLLQYTNDTYAECWVLPSYENIAWLVMVISFISLIAITAVFAICFLIRQQRSNQLRSQRLKESNGISYQTVKSMPSVIYDSRCERGGSYDSCAVCLEDFVDGAVLRVLPCNHRFHCTCIDAWLINWRAFCPICKQDVIKAIPATENTPLLQSVDNPQQGAIPSSEDSSPPSEGACAIAINTGPPSDRPTHSCCFSFNRPPLRSSGTPIRTSWRSRHLSWTSLNDQNSVEAFRASPYFTPPSSFHGSAPNVLFSLESASNDDLHQVGSPPQSSDEPRQSRRSSHFL